MVALGTVCDGFDYLGNAHKYLKGERNAGLQHCNFSLLPWT